MEQDLISLGFEKLDMYWTNGREWVLQSVDEFYQVHIDPTGDLIKADYNLIRTIEELVPNKTFHKGDKSNPQVVAKLTKVKKPNKEKTKPPLPSNIVRVSGKWYKDTTTGKFWHPDHVERKWKI